MNDLIKDITPSELQHISTRITDGVGSIIEQSKRTIAVYLNSEVSMTYWKIGKYIAGELDAIGEDKYGAKIVSTLSRLLTEQFGKGYTRAGIFRMVKVARAFPDAEIVATLSHQLTWSHFIELAIDLKLGKFKPEYKGQMELYLKYLKKYEMQPGEEDPIGLLLCSEGNTEHIELLMLDEQNIKVAQYLTVLPEKQWFIDKMNRSSAIARELQDRKEAE